MNERKNIHGFSCNMIGRLNLPLLFNVYGTDIVFWGIYMSRNIILINSRPYFLEIIIADMLLNILWLANGNAIMGCIYLKN